MIDYLTAMWGLAINGQKQGVVFFAALYALVLLGYSFVYQRRIRAWPSTRGALIKATLQKMDGTDLLASRQDYAASALYEFDVGDATYRGSRISPWVMLASHNARFLLEKQLRGIQQYEDGRVKVFFNPKNPKKSFLIRPSALGLAVTAALAVTPMALYWFSYHV